MTGAFDDKEVANVKSNVQYCPYCMTPIQDGKICPRCGLTAGNYVPQPHHLRPGTLLMDRYLVGRVLGEGGFGITYIGCDLRLELKVAIKEYYPVDNWSVLVLHLHVLALHAARPDFWKKPEQWQKWRNSR